MFMGTEHNETSCRRQQQVHLVSCFYIILPSKKKISTAEIHTDCTIMMQHWTDIELPVWRHAVSAQVIISSKWQNDNINVVNYDFLIIFHSQQMVFSFCVQCLSWNNTHCIYITILYKYVFINSTYLSTLNLT